MERKRYTIRDKKKKILFVKQLICFFLGVGELKILHHPIKNSYRLLLRREQVFKCVLNHSLSTDYVIQPMKQSDRAFCWSTNNYADDPAGVLEQLSVRFKNSEIAQRFEEAVNKCISQLKLEPEED